MWHSTRISDVAWMIGIGLLSLAALSRAETGATGLDVKAFGAKGDGTADDTGAFRKAIEGAGRLPPGRLIRVPPGSYRITTPLTLDSALLSGLEAGGWPADSRPLPTLIVDVPVPQPCILAKTGASLHGLCFDFDYRGNRQREFGPCVKLEGGGVSITNVLMHNPTFGAVADNTVNCERTNLENLFIVNARRCGVQFEHGLDVVTMRNVEVWNYLPDLLTTCTGFRIGHVDEIRLSNCAVVAAAVGFHFVQTKTPPEGKPGGAWGGMENCTVDFSGVAVKIDTASALRIHGGSLRARHFGVVVDGAGDVLPSGTDIRANSNHCLHVKGGDSLTVSGCLLKKNSKGGEQQPEVLGSVRLPERIAQRRHAYPTNRRPWRERAEGERDGRASTEFRSTLIDREGTHVGSRVPSWRSRLPPARILVMDLVPAHDRTKSRLDAGAA